MINFKELVLMNEATIIYLDMIDEDTQRNQIINKILKDETCFFKLEREQSYIILRDIGISEEKLEETYEYLISEDVYYNLEKQGKIRENKNELLVKYEKYNGNPFNKKI